LSAGEHLDGRMSSLQKHRDGSVPLLEAARNAVLFVLFASVFVAGSAAVLYGGLSVLLSSGVARGRAGLAALAVFALAVAAATSLLAVLDRHRRAE